MKKLLFILFIMTVIVPLCAESPRYKGLAVGLYGTGDFMIGDYADVANAGAGGGVWLEYTAFSFQKLDAGFSIRGDFSHVFPKSGSLLQSDNDLIFTGGVFLRVPFASFAFVPEIDYGGILHFARGSSGSHADGVYFDQIICVSAALRYVPPFAPRLEMELAPTFSFCPEKENKILIQAGARLGAVWHFKTHSPRQ